VTIYVGHPNKEVVRKANMGILYSYLCLFLWRWKINFIPCVFVLEFEKLWILSHFMSSRDDVNINIIVA